MEESEEACVWSKWHDGAPAEKMALLPGAQEHILQQEHGKQRFMQVVTDLSQAFALCAGSEEALEIRDDIGFFQAVKPRSANRAARARQPKSSTTPSGNWSARQSPEGEIIDVFQAAGEQRLKYECRRNESRHFLIHHSPFALPLEPRPEPRVD